MFNPHTRPTRAAQTPGALRLTRRLIQRTLAGGALVALGASGSVAHAAGGFEWPVWSGSISGKSNAAQETKISPATVGKLTPKWTYTPHGDIVSTPTVDGPFLYFSDYGGYISKLRRDDGTLVWEKKISTFTGNEASLSRNSPAISGNSLIFGDRKGAVIMAVDKETGELQWKRSVDTDGKGFITTSPMVYKDVAYIGVSSAAEFEILIDGKKKTVFRGSVWALDLKNKGAELWHRNTAPPGYTGVSVWSSPIVVDPAREAIYVTTANNVTVPDSVSACINAIGKKQNLADQETLAKQLACVDPDNYVDAIVAFDMKTGKTKWAQRMMGVDLWNFYCLINVRSGCPVKGVDWDFGSGANLIDTVINGKPRQLVGAGQKNGYYWALDPDTGEIVWSIQAGPPSLFGGIHWGTATDDKRVYVPESNNELKPVTLADGSTWRGAYWAALDAATGKVLWQTKSLAKAPLGGTQNATTDSALTVANGVLFAGRNNGDFMALDASTGKELWRFDSGGSVLGAPSVVDGEVYWGTGYYRGKSKHQLYAFHIKASP